MSTTSKPLLQGQPHCLVAINLIAFRRQADFTLEELADELGISSEALARMERGKEPIFADMLLQMAQVLGRSVNDFFEGIEAFGGCRCEARRRAEALLKA